MKGEDGQYKITNEFKIAYTVWGDRGPIVLFLHGVPTNRRQWWPIQKRVAPFARTVSIDMLGMGESDKPRDYGINRDGSKQYPDDLNDPWDWINDVEYVDQLMNTLFPGEKFTFVADDWGSGINSHYAAIFDSNRLDGFVQLDPIAFDGYPVAEIQAIGRASQIPVEFRHGMDDGEFKEAMGAFDQTVVQIFKTMVYDPNVYNQYNLRDLKFPYADVDYERNRINQQTGEREYATSLTLGLNFEAIRVLADRAAILSPALLLPYDEAQNPKGVNYERISVPSLILWGEYDNMMPTNQIYRFKLAMPNSRVHIHKIPRAGHFAGADQPLLVSEEIVNFLTEVHGIDGLADIFLGYTGIWKGDERQMIMDMRVIYDTGY
jgi:pimeloyl-ACP methyl ester carboxylesterase